MRTTFILILAIVTAGLACDLRVCAPDLVSYHEARCAAGDDYGCRSLAACDATACADLPGCEP